MLHKITETALQRWISLISKARHPKTSGSRSFMTWKDALNSFRILEMRASILLKLKYPTALMGYIDPKSMYQFTCYVPELELYIDYYEPWYHLAPHNLPIPFDPLNQDHSTFVWEASNLIDQHPKWYWISAMRAQSWGGADFRKEKYMRFHRMKHQIYYKIYDIEAQVSNTDVRYSKQLMKVYNSMIDLQDIVNKPVQELMHLKDANWNCTDLIYKTFI